MSGRTARRLLASALVLSLVGVPDASGASIKTRRAAVKYAKSKLGKPYVYGATGPSSFDCSGLMYAAYRKRIPRTSYAQLAASWHSRKRKVGDLLFRGSGHVGIYVGRGRAIHATRPGRPISYISASYFDSWGVPRLRKLHIKRRRPRLIAVSSPVRYDAKGHKWARLS